VSNSGIETEGFGSYLALGGLFLQPGNRDWDGDGIFNSQDNCADGTPGWTSTGANDFDGDGCDDATEDTDDDADGYPDTMESDCGTDPLNGTDYPVDIDGDGLCAPYDDDDDGDGVLDVDDDFPEDQYGFVQLSLGDGFQSGQPEDNATLGASRYSTCTILSDGTLRCWGDNRYGQIGDGSSGSDKYSPTNVSIPNGKTPVSVSSTPNGNTVCSIMDDGTLYCWGANYDGQIGIGTHCASGNYLNGCNGVEGISTPTMVSLPMGRTATAVALGSDHTCSILDDGSVWCWGSNNNGGLGVGNMSSGSWAYSPNQALLPSGLAAVSISLGAGHSCVVVDDGRAFCWGYNGDGNIGDGTSGTNRVSPTEVSGTASYVSISAGSNHNCAITNTGTVKCWGDNWNQALGLGYYTANDQTTPQDAALPAGIDVSSISLGQTHSCAVLETMSVYCWGKDDNLQLGTTYICEGGDNTNGCSSQNSGNRHTPAQAQLPPGRGGIAVAAGGYFTCVFIDNGGVYCFGANDDGQLGNGSTYGTGPSYVGLPVGVSPQPNDRDLDHDGVFNNEDDCMEGETDWTSNSTTDNDGDGCQDSSEDDDDDNDGLNDTEEAALGTNSTDPDTDDDGYLDGLDEFPLDGTEWLDTDGDGIGNNADTDDDGDGWSDAAEYSCQTDSLNGTDVPDDFDGDGNCDYTDNDDDNDGTYDSQDDFQFDGSADTDTDGDGMPDEVIGYDLNLIPDNGLIGYWNMEDTSGDPVDSSQEHQNSTMNGNPQYGINGQFGSAIDFDGNGDYIEIEADDSFNVTDITISFWVNLSYIVNSVSDPMANAGLVCRGDWAAEVWCVDLEYSPWTTPNLGFRFWHRHGSNLGVHTGIKTTSMLDSGNWTHVVATYDGTTSKIYLNGQLEDSTTGTQGDLVTSSSPVYIAARANTTGVPTYSMNASMDEVRIYNRILNSSEIQILYLATTLIADTDDDNDGWSDEDEIACGYNTLSNSSTPTDTDGDTVCDDLDVFPNNPDEWDDTDGDGVGDNGDDFPDDANETTDTDGDGIGDNGDPDADDDGWSNTEEGLCLTDWLDNTSVPGDIDGDGICDAQEQDLDNDGWTNSNESVCGTDWTDVNSVPVDTDGDWICDIMDNDDDGDGYFDDVDAFPLNPAEWADTDGDGVGNNADPDDDNDGCMDISDDLPLDPTECVDTDGDGTGNNADTDDDNDGLPDDEDPFPEDGAATVDTDGDGMPDSLNGNSTTGLVADPDDDNDGYNDTDDAFPLDDTEWYDTDGDGIGNNEDINDDGDNCPDVTDDFPLDPAECYDTDGDGIGNNADTDDDNDGWFDGTEMACGTSDPLNASSVPDDFDGDGVCDLMDVDDDNDSYLDSNDDFPYDPCAAVDTDGDGMPDWIFLNCNTTLTEDADDDDDGYEDANDTFPEDPSEWSDFDGDGIGNNADTDDDGDTVPDDYDEFPLNSTEWADNDGDGIGDNADTDDDNDGTLDTDDDFPFDAGATTDTDNDGMPDTVVSGYNGSLTEDLDDDGDGVLDIYDAFPLDSSEWSDTDGDGTGDNADADDDGDTWSDSDEYICGTDPLDSTDWPPDSDGDGICDSEDDDGPTTLGAKLIQFAAHPVTLWMLAIGVVVSLFLGMTATSMSMRRSREMRRDMLRDESSSVDRGVGWDRPTPGVEIPVQTSTLTATPVVEDSQAKLQKLIDQGYSTEVAQVILENEEN